MCYSLLDASRASLEHGVTLSQEVALSEQEQSQEESTSTPQNEEEQAPEPRLKIWVDADGCPRPVKEIVFRAAARLELETVLVANRPLATPKSMYVSSIVVSSGLDVADDWIAERVDVRDVVITADIPLAARIVERGATGISPHGEVYTEANVRERLSVRDFMHELREQGVQTGGPPPFGPRDKQNFANALDRILTKRVPKT
jgi:hypothetical protein